MVMLVTLHLTLLQLFSDIKKVVLMPSKKNDNKIHLLLEKYNFSKDLIYYYDESFIDETRASSIILGCILFFAMVAKNHQII